MSGFIDVVVLWTALSIFAGMAIVFYVNGNFDNAYGRDYRPATYRTWVRMFLEAFIPTIVAFGLVILFLLGIAYLSMPYYVAGVDAERGVIPMFVFILLVIVLAISILLGLAIWCAEIEEIRKDEVFYNKFLEKHAKDHERWIAYLKRRP